MNEPTPEEAAAALRAVREGRERVIKSAMGSRGLWIFSGLFVFVYCAAEDLFPGTQPWLNLVMLALVLALAFGMRTRVGATMLGRPVAVSGRSLPLTFKWRLLRIAPILAIGIGVSLIIVLLRVPHGPIYYGAIAGLYITFLGPRFQLWLLRRQDKD